jgi:hypothetical protein
VGCSAGSVAEIPSDMYQRAGKSAGRAARVLAALRAAPPIRHPSRPRYSEGMGCFAVMVTRTAI